MAKYFNTFYTNEGNFLQIEKTTFKKSIVKYFNFLILFISLLSLVIYYEEINGKIPSVINENISNENINNENVKNENLINDNVKIDNKINSNILETSSQFSPKEGKKEVQTNNKIILIEIVKFIDEEDITDFIDDVKKELKDLKEIKATILINRSKFGVIKQVKIQDIEDYNNLKTIFEKIQYDSNIIVTIE
jgi:hypothetical protein